MFSVMLYLSLFLFENVDPEFWKAVEVIVSNLMPTAWGTTVAKKLPDISGESLGTNY